MDSEEKFIDFIKDAACGDDPQARVEQALAKALEIWNGPPPWIGRMNSGTFDLVYASDDLTIMHIVWPPRMITEPHTHSMWATIGLYAGRENNILWNRAGDSIEAVDAKSITKGDVCSFEPDVIHSVHNPLHDVTGAIHIYGGDFMNAQNSEWDQLTLEERPRDMAEQQRLFAKG